MRTPATHGQAVIPAASDPSRIATATPVLYSIPASVPRIAAADEIVTNLGAERR